VLVQHSEKRRQRLVENARQPATPGDHALIVSAEYWHIGVGVTPGG
jgi:hypothetical protein